MASTALPILLVLAVALGAGWLAWRRRRTAASGKAPARPWRWRRWLAVLAALLALPLLTLAVAPGPVATLLMAWALPRALGDLQVVAYQAQGPAPVLPEALRLTLPRAQAHRWFMAAAGQLLPAQVAAPGAWLAGALAGGGSGDDLPVQVISAADDQRARLELTLDARRVDRWLLQGAVRDRSAWVVRIDPGSRLSDDGLVAAPPWDLSLRLHASGTAARRDGQPGLWRIDELGARLDLRWLPQAGATLVAAHVQLDRLRLTDLRSDQVVDAPAFVLGLVAEAVDRGLAASPPRLPFAIDPTAGASLRIVAPSAAEGTPAF